MMREGHRNLIALVAGFALVIPAALVIKPLIPDSWTVTAPDDPFNNECCCEER